MESLDSKMEEVKLEDNVERRKPQKPKGPVNVDKQCGVPHPNGGFCGRSLTCKSHSMGVKRLVPGRSLPYDQLLARYQKREQAKIHKAALKAALEAKAPRHRTLEKGSEEMGDWEII